MRATRLAVIVLTPLLLLAACGGGTTEQAEPEMAEPPPPPPPPPPPETPPADTAPAADETPPAPPPKTLSVSLASKSKSKVTGTVTVSETDGGVKVSVQVANAKPGEHGMHIHEKADCSAPDAKSAGDHFNPDKHPHGMPDTDKRHLGDLGNLTVGQDGTGTVDVVVKGANLKADDPMSFIGRSLVVHDKKDDGKSQPAGNSGARIACAELSEGGSASGTNPAGTAADSKAGATPADKPAPKPAAK